MRRPLRTSLLACITLLSLTTVMTGVFALRGTDGPESGLVQLRSEVASAIDAERVALELHRTLRAAEIAVASNQPDVLVEPREAFRDALRSLRSRMRREPAEAPAESTYANLDLYTRRALALAGEGRRDEALDLLRDDLSLLAAHRVLEPLEPWIESFDERTVRSLDRALSGAAQHWTLAPSLGESARDELLARNVEAILVWRLTRQAAETMRAAQGVAESAETIDGTWRRVQRVARIARDERRLDPDLAAGYRAWRGAMEATRTGEGTLDEAWRRFDDDLAPAARTYASALRGELGDSLGALQGPLARLRAWILACMIFAVTLAALAPSWVSSRISIPLRRIADWADGLRRGEKDVSLPESSPDEVGTATHALREMASTFADLTRRAETLAFYDSVTGLPNRQLLQERLQTSLVWAQINHRMVGLLTVSLSSFKQINDAHGHDVGDLLLREVAERLAHVVRLGDLVTRPGSDKAIAHLARLGGAEFTLMLSDLADASDAGRVAHRILSRMSEPFDVDGEQLFADPSVGIAIYPIDGTDASQLVAHANVAAHHARLNPSSQYQYYSEAMNAAASRRLTLGSRLRGALERDELSILFQPIRDARSGRVSCAEVLLRWNDGELGPIPPSEFISVAEELSLIGPIGDWVVRAACEQERAWRERGFAQLRFAVNASPLQLRDEGWVERVAEILEKTGTSPGQIEIEITESSIMHDDGTTVATLTGLHEMGISVALDDFGTGYSSLSYLRRFPIDRVKIDRSFVAEIGTDDDGTQLTAAMLAMAQSLRLRVVAEGIETESQADFLCARGCDELQGFLFSPPVPAAEFERFLELEKEEAEERERGAGTPIDGR